MSGVLLYFIHVIVIIFHGQCKSVCVFFKELNTGNAADDADEMPEVQETVTMIPGSTLLWRITPRPAHSDQVTSSNFFPSAFAEMFNFYYFRKTYTVSTQVFMKTV